MSRSRSGVYAATISTRSGSGAPATPRLLDELKQPAYARIAIGQPASVPVGRYTRSVLEQAGLWQAIEPKMIGAQNVRQALDYVTRGEVDAGFVYATDVAVRRTRVKEAFRPGEDTYRPVTYPAAVVTDSRHAALGRAFIEMLLSAEGQSVLRQRGFQPPPGPR